MRINKRDRTITLNESDHGYQILLYSKTHDDLINLKVNFTDKAFGVQAFSELEDDDVERDDVVVFLDNNQARVSEYAGIWKVIPQLKKAFSKKWKQYTKRRGPSKRSSA